MELLVLKGSQGTCELGRGLQNVGLGRSWQTLGQATAKKPHSLLSGLAGQALSGRATWGHPWEIKRMKTTPLFPGWQSLTEGHFLKDEEMKNGQN